MGRGKKLFKTDVNKLKVGVTSGHHVVHIIGEKNPNDGGVEITDELMNSKGKNRPLGSEITQAEVFSNPSDLKTKERFLNIAKLIAEEYEKPGIDDDYANFLIATKDFLLADSHSTQQTALAMLIIAGNVYREKMQEKVKKLEQKKDKKALAQIKIQGKDYLKTVKALKEALGPLNGSLEIPKDYKVPSEDEIQEPKGNNFFDKGGIWQPSTDCLFPHEPSPNDIKQGVGIMDCFVLSTLIQIAEKNPDEIKKRMKDNGNGTVSVRFNDKGNGNKPVIVTVKKTVNQTLFGQNYYAASSLWVQMLEKAFAEYNKITNTRTSKHSIADSKNGFASLNRGSSENFLNAFLEEPFTSGKVRIPYTTNMKNAITMEPDKLDRYLPKDKYLPEEKALAEFYMEKLHQGEIITVGVTPANAQFSVIDYKGLGIRPGHAYTFRDVVKRTVNGVDKYFVQLRDPYASFKTGFDENGKLVNKSQAVKGFFNAGTDNMGTFEMEFRDFATMFDSLCGISKNTYNELNSIPFRNYYGPSALDENELKNGVDETKERETSSPINDLLDGERMGKSDYVIEMEKLVKDVSSVAWKDIQRDMTMEKLSGKDDFEKIQRNLMTAYNDLRGTDQWFVWTNTEKFAALRDNLSELNTMMAKAAKEQKGKDFNLDDKTKRAIADKMMTVREMSIDYLSSKNIEINSNLIHRKGVSNRAVIRTLAAANIEAITGLSEPYESWMGMTEKKLKLITSDVVNRIDFYKQGLQVPHEDLNLDKSYKGNENERKALQIKINGQYKKQLITTADNLEKYLRVNDMMKDPEIKNNVAKIDTFNRNIKEHGSDFVDFEDAFEEPQKKDDVKSVKSLV